MTKLHNKTIIKILDLIKETNHMTFLQNSFNETKIKLGNTSKAFLHSPQEV